MSLLPAHAGQRFSRAAEIARLHDGDSLGWKERDSVQCCAEKHLVTRLSVDPQVISHRFTFPSAESGSWKLRSKAVGEAIATGALANRLASADASENNCRCSRQVSKHGLGVQSPS